MCWLRTTSLWWHKKPQVLACSPQCRQALQILLCLNQTKCSIIFRLDLFCTSAPRHSVTRDNHKKLLSNTSPFCLLCRGSSLPTVAALGRQPCYKRPNHHVSTWGTWLSASGHKTASLLVLINTAKISRLLMGCLRCCLGAQLTCCSWSTSFRGSSLKFSLLACPT